MPKLSDYLLPEEIDDLIGPVCEIADMGTGKDRGEVVDDPDMDALVLAAQKIRDREGFLVTDGDI